MAVGLTNLDSLSLDQKELCKRYLELSSFGGVLSSAILGKEEWDIRPVILKTSKLFILRTVPTTLIEDEAATFRLKNIYTWLKQEALNNQEIVTGEIASR
ncbi:MAG: hypothetical protein KDD56_07390, partial [Bdellovibrionales bacterium]|nr:hypothetical protein [Bdellovibrionales bacterium]